MRNESRDQLLGENVLLADGWWTRLRGMLGRPEPGAGGGMLIEPCQAVHMYGMRYALDVAFIARDGRVVEVYEELAPARRSRWHAEARCALELPTGTLRRTGTRPGDVLRVEHPGTRN